MEGAFDTSLKESLVYFLESDACHSFYLDNIWITGAVIVTESVHQGAVGKIYCLKQTGVVFAECRRQQLLHTKNGHFSIMAALRADSTALNYVQNVCCVHQQLTRALSTT